MASFTDPRVTEKRFLAIPPQQLTANGTTDGIITISNTYGYKVGQIVTVISNAVQPRRLKIKAVISETEIKVGEINSPIYKFSNVSDLLTADNAMVELIDDAINSGSQASNRRPTIDLHEIQRQVYEEEPTVALRSHLVDWLGRSYSSSNPVPVEGTINLTLDSVTTPNVVRIAAPIVNTEYSFPLPINTRRYRFRVEDSDAKARIAWTIGETADNQNYWTVNRGSYYEDNSIDATSGITLYFRLNKANQTVQIQYWE